MAGPAAPGVGTTRVDWGPVELKTPKTGDLAPLANWSSQDAKFEIDGICPFQGRPWLCQPSSNRGLFAALSLTSHVQYRREGLSNPIFFAYKPC